MKPVELHLEPMHIIPFIYMYPPFLENEEQGKTMLDTMNNAFVKLFHSPEHRGAAEFLSECIFDALDNAPLDIQEVFWRYAEIFVELGMITPTEP